MPFLHIILSIKDSLQQQIHYNRNILVKKCCRCNEGSLYQKEEQTNPDRQYICNEQKKKSKTTSFLFPNEVITLPDRIHQTQQKNIEHAKTDTSFPLLIPSVFVQGCSLLWYSTNFAIRHSKHTHRYLTLPYKFPCLHTA